MLKIRRPLGRLIFNMGIAIPGKTVFLIETAPRFLQILLWQRVLLWCQCYNLDNHDVKFQIHIKLRVENLKQIVPQSHHLSGTGRLLSPSRSGCPGRIICSYRHGCRKLSHVSSNRRNDESSGQRSKPCRRKEYSRFWTNWGSANLWEIHYHTEVQDSKPLFV